jgi:O-antigen/teichoic acid export membrane protein
MLAGAEDENAAESASTHHGLGREIRRLGSQTFVYGLGGVALQLVGVVTLPIFARYFSPTEFGILELGTVVAAILAIVVDAGMASASQRSYFDHGDDEEAIRRRILTTAFLTQLGVAALLALLLAVYAAPLSRLLFDGREESTVVVLIAASLPAFVTAQFTREVLRLEFRAWSYLGTAVAGAVIGAVISVLTVVSWDMGVAGPFFGIVAGFAAGGAYGLLLVWRRLTARPSVRELRVMLHFGIPLVPTALALWALSLIDRVMLANLADLDEVGQYAMANRVAIPVMLIVVALQLSFSPFILSIYQSDPEHEKRVRARVLTDFSAALVFVGLVMSLWAQEILDIVAPAFDAAYEAAGLVAFGLVAYGISSVVVAGISLARQTKWLVLYSVTAALLNIALNLALIPPLGQVGAAIATLVAYLLLCAMYYRRAQTLYYTPYRARTVIAVFTTGLVLVPLGAIEYADAAVAWLVKLSALAAFVLALRPLGIVRRGDLARAVAWARAR